MPLDRLWLHSARGRAWRWLLDEIVHAPLEPILHPSRMRLLWIGIFSVAGHLLFYFIWARWIPQPYESPWMRAAMATLALIYLLPRLRLGNLLLMPQPPRTWAPGSMVRW